MYMYIQYTYDIIPVSRTDSHFTSCMYAWCDVMYIIYYINQVSTPTKLN